ncbi:MAG: CPBP family glutamic-type intramembrane protease [Solirubrobacterales bacterium]
MSEPGVEFASFSRRLAAALLDSVVWFIGISWILSSFPPGFFEDNKVAGGVIVLLLLSVAFNYFAICEWRFGQTIGKNALGIRVLPVAAGAELSYNDAALRNLLRLVDLPLALIGVDWLLVERSPRSQRLGDRTANTVVVRERAKQAPEPVRPAAPGPTSGELFGEASAALGGVAKPAGPPGAAPTPAPPAAPPPPSTPSQVGAAPPLAASAPVQAAFPYSNWGPKVAIVGVLAAILGGIVLGVPAILIDQPSTGEDLSTAANVFVQLATVLGFVAVPLYVARKRSDSMREALGRLGVRSFRPSAIGWMFAAAGAYIALAAVYAIFITQPKQEDIASSFGPVWVQVLLIVACAAISEELCFRGMVFGGIRERLPGVAAALASGAVFGSLHVFTGITAVPPLIIFGTVLALLYERTGSIIPAVILHALNNTAALFGQ